MLGTGNAAVTQCYNTCFALRNGEQYLLVDAGGGNGILRQLELADIPLEQIPALMLTHAHTDHLLGCVWIVRMIGQKMNAAAYSGDFQVYSHSEALHVLEWICRNCLPAKISNLFSKRIHFNSLESEDFFHCAGLDYQCFDIGSKKCKQFGFNVQLSEGKNLICLGDEPLSASNKQRASCATWLMSEAFCLASQADIFKPYEKHHSTALDAGIMAQQLAVENLILYHTEDKSLETRKASYRTEAAQNFIGKIHVPNDLERILLEN